MTIVEQKLEARRLLNIYFNTRTVAEKMGLTEAQVVRLLGL